MTLSNPRMNTDPTQAALVRLLWAGYAHRSAYQIDITA